MSRLPISRRNALKGIGAAVALGTLAKPAILRASDQVKIGFIAPLTGSEAILGAVQLQCYQIALDELNKAGGIGGREIVSIVEDDETNAKATIDKTRKLVAKDNVDLVLGTLASFERTAALSVTSRAKKLFIYPTYYEGGDCSPLLVNTGQVPSQQIDPLAEYLTDNVGKSVYVIGHDYSWPRGSTDQLKAGLEARGGKLVGAEFVPFGMSDFGPSFAKIKEADPDIVSFMLVADDAITAVKQYRSFDMKQPLVFHAWDDVMLGAVSPAEQAGIIASQGYFQQVDTPANNAFVKTFADKFGADKPINYIGISCYQTPMLYAEAVKKAGSLDPEKVVAAISQVEVDGPIGMMRVEADTNHVVMGNYVAQVTDNAQFEIKKHTAPTPPQAGCTL
ncbi:substrate-binding protein [Microbaculum marinisediminis]|uniref:Substrate-binding protein n=1 Tax=Microbaculum marinisediminis TaxID=2931392 RepID=A0AAW5R0T4_9HYPH|nr:substrate-binding protein [Microbaculum sp. A6E488]MCT8972940.1 substrate-binding protein [Microbaculum sp. A6E488]